MPVPSPASVPVVLVFRHNSRFDISLQASKIIASRSASVNSVVLSLRVILRTLVSTVITAILIINPEYKIWQGLEKDCKTSPRRLRKQKALRWR